MEDILIQGFNILTQSLINSYLILTVAKKITNNTFTKNQILINSIFVFIGILLGTLLQPLGSGINTIAIILLFTISIIFVLKLKPLKALFLTLLTFTIIAITELLSAVVIAAMLNKSLPDLLAGGKIYTFYVVTLQNIFILALIQIFKYFFMKNDNLKFNLKNITSRQLKIFIFTIIIYIVPQMILILVSHYSYPIMFFIINSIQFILTSAFLLIYLKKDIEYTKTQSDLINSEMHNRTMVGMVDGIRTLKHDYNNIMQSLNGYIATKQYDKLQEHIDEVLKECNVLNNLELIYPNIFNEPSIYGIVSAKYFIATEQDINFDINISTSIKDIEFPKPELSRIIGLLLDNAIEATVKTKNKYIRLEIYFDNRKSADIIKITNTYDTNIDIDSKKIFDKGFSTKEIKSGIGLWEAKKFVKPHKHVQLFAKIENEKFTQNLIIEK